MSISEEEAAYLNDLERAWADEGLPEHARVCGEVLHRHETDLDDGCEVHQCWGPVVPAQRDGEQAGTPVHQCNWCGLSWTRVDQEEPSDQDHAEREPAG
jgi:hypothetical protein